MIDRAGMNADVAGWWASSMWWLCGVDTALPVGDIIYFSVLSILLIAGAGTIAKTPEMTVPNLWRKEREKAEEKSDVTVIPKQPDGLVIFPVDPNTFTPVRLVKVPRIGTKNGGFISWMDPQTNIEVFRWDQNPNYHNGAHYHILGTGHYYPGDLVPEPYASMYFPVG